jgi:hypothetical protein
MKSLVISTDLSARALRLHRWLLAGLLAILGGCGDADTPAPQPTADAATVTANTVLLDAEQLGQIESIAVDENGDTHVKTISSSVLNQSLVVGNVILIPPGLATTYPLGLVGRITSIVTTDDNSTVAKISRATFADVIQKSNFKAEPISLNSSNFVGVIAPNAVRAAAANNSTFRFTGSASKLQRNGNMRPLEEIKEITSDEILIDLKITLSSMGLDATRMKPYGSATEAGFEIKGSLRNLQLTRDHSFEKTASVPTGLKSLDLRLSGDVNLDVKLFGGVEADLGYFSQAWAEVEEEHFRLLGVSAKLTGLDSKDKMGKYPVAGLVFSVECPPSGCPTIYGQTKTPLSQVKSGGIIVWVYINANGKIVLDGEAGARVNLARLTLGMVKPSNGRLDGVFELTSNTVGRLIEAPYFNGAAALSISLSTTIDLDFFALGVRLGNVSTDIGYRTNTSLETSTPVSWGTTKLGEPWSWDGNICIRTSVGAGAILSYTINIGTEIDTSWNKIDAGLIYTYSNQWPSDQEISIPGLHYFLTLPIWFTSVGSDSCSVTYMYTGNTFDTFHTASVFTTSDRVTARLSLSNPLRPNLTFYDVTGLPGFNLSMSDGHQTFSSTNATSSVTALVSTDSTGKLVGPWHIRIQQGGPLDPMIYSWNVPGEVFDISASGQTVQGTSRDVGSRASLPGIWSMQLESTDVLAAKRLAAGGSHSLAVTADGTVWGQGTGLGLGVGAPSVPWSKLNSPSAVAAVAAGGGHSLAITKQGDLWTTGWNAAGQLGLGDKLDRAIWTQVVGMSNVTAVSSAGSASLALTASGAIWATGDGQYGNFGMAAPNGLDTWKQVPGTSDFVAIAAGFAHSLAVKRDGSLWVTGGSQIGWSGLGLGLPFAASAIQQWTQVSGMTSVTAIAAGADYSLAVTSTGSLWVAGNNSAGQLGLGDQTYRSTWTKTNLVDVVAVSTGTLQSFALQRDGSVWAAGANAHGTLGLGDREIRVTWTKLNLPVGARALAGSNIRSVAILRDGTVWETGDGGSNVIPFGPGTTVWQQTKGITGF